MVQKGGRPAIGFSTKVIGDIYETGTPKIKASIGRALVWRTRAAWQKDSHACFLAADWHYTNWQRDKLSNGAHLPSAYNLYSFIKLEELTEKQAAIVRTRLQFMTKGAQKEDIPDEDEYVRLVLKDGGSVKVLKETLKGPSKPSSAKSDSPVRKHQR